MKDILSIDEFSNQSIEILFSEADHFKDQLTSPTKRQELAHKHIGRQLCSLFYEPSTRTRLSFEKAAANFGIIPISTENAREFSSAAKGETIEDTIKVLNEYGFDIIVLRHHQTGAAQKAASVSITPIINAGDGKGEHPTQALLDAYTIYNQFNRLDNLNITIGGDLANGRTVRSLAKLLSMYPNNHIDFVSIPELQIGEDIKKHLKKNGTSFNETSKMHQPLKNADVIYWTRIQKERLKDPSSLPKNGYEINKHILDIISPHAIIMHPLPRVDEILPEVDHDKRAMYFKQAGNGLFIRMALIDQLIES